jgi:hypothetical protein
MHEKNIRYTSPGLTSIATSQAPAEDRLRADGAADVTLEVAPVS